MPATEFIRCIIIEDELPAMEILEMHISKIPFLQLTGKFASVAKTLAAVDPTKIDLIFLDINLPGISGTSFAKSLNAESSIIFTTAYSEFAVDGFELDAIDYLLKPVSFERFTRAVNRYLKYHQHKNQLIPTTESEYERPFVFVKCERRMVKIFLDEILYIEAQRNYLLIYKENEVYKAHQSISEIAEKLPENLFIRIHRSFIIALTEIEGYTSSYVIIRKKYIPIGRLYKSSSMKFLIKGCNNKS